MRSISEKEKIVEEILLGNYDRYYRLAYSYVRHEADAGDIVQNGAYRAIRSSRELKQQYEGLHMSEEQLEQMRQAIEKAKGENHMDKKNIWQKWAVAAAVLSGTIIILLI